MPSGLETMSFKILAQDERTWSCFLAWDENKDSPHGGKGYYVIHAELITPEEFLKTDN